MIYEKNSGSDLLKSQSSSRSNRFFRTTSATGIPDANNSAMQNVKSASRCFNTRQRQTRLLSHQELSCHEIRDSTTQKHDKQVL
ncbi:hypothetical protein PoB_000923800 [Plakobranchus ocellatus]|uniref:Uncharacterized protein n=1 Tax=Plakobranchus ocellatus TaxID=259542 RepID=A0AAV3YKH8_9GAST|nr:hypothetical protein PoB_000923800 [Plakobranchus ocellatus]